MSMHSVTSRVFLLLLSFQSCYESDLHLLEFDFEYKWQLICCDYHPCIVCWILGCLFDDLINLASMAIFLNCCIHFNHPCTHFYAYGFMFPQSQDEYERESAKARKEEGKRYVFNHLDEIALVSDAVTLSAFYYRQLCRIRNSSGVVKMLELQKVRITEIRVIEVFVWRFSRDLTILFELAKV